MDSQELIKAMSDMIDAKLKEALEPIRKDIEQLKENHKEIISIRKDTEQLKENHKEIISIRKDIEQLKENHKEIISIRKDTEQLKENHKELISRFDKLDDAFIDLDGKNANNHLIIKTEVDDVNSNIKSLSEDINFLTHKGVETEKEVFTIKKKLEVIK